ncbi:MAG: reverse transcriptase/maturase family protein [bacterium]
MLEYERHLVDNILALHEELSVAKYRHGIYQDFFVNDPKRRHIHKASVRDRVLHHALYRKLYTFFDQRFVADSFSCRNWKGTHAAMNRFRDFARKVSLNHRRTCWVLKCDIRKFFASIDQNTLLGILRRYIFDERIFDLLRTIVTSYPKMDSRLRGNDGGIGLPLGNLTSQLLANAYMNEFDQFVKHELRVKYYLRYADDFVFLHHEKQYLECLLPVIDDFLCRRLKLQLHPDKVFIETLASGVDFLGWVHFSDHRILRTATKKRMMRRLLEESSKERTTSYLGLCSHGNASKLIASFTPICWSS